MLDLPVYTPQNWYWSVGEDARIWSSKARGYVESVPKGTPVTPIKSESDLTDVLAVHDVEGPVVRIPDRVSPAQAEIALYQHDNGILLGRVNALIEAYPYEPVRIWWRKATYISRGHPYLWALSIELGLADEMVDTLFLTAAKL
ncbi:hypothetical protein ACFFTN_01470 [Aminobacter aganoensis]|uniref:Uncharacterized protein n=1 Tax=Aminobacter aganoensis TaxID=83264 RepID=A0A7X0F5G0_9HYPH|nr:hypothetical protein [Aminobacter aganoensis]MBB6353471.1 hypothetical protein [Aminobacter aganoensis]